LTPANLKQVRTNEFLVGPQDPAQKPAAWELREFHLGSDAKLHQSLLPLQIDPAAVQTSADFLTWAQSNATALARGTATFPAAYQVPTGSEDGTIVSLSDATTADLVNRSTCAGCHTTATNSAFAHVAERFAGTGRAEISAFLAGELTKRANHLGLVASGVVNAPLDVRPLH
jgi:cytochrome c553